MARFTLIKLDDDYAYLTRIKKKGKNNWKNQLAICKVAMDFLRAAGLTEIRMNKLIEMEIKVKRITKNAKKKPTRKPVSRKPTARSRSKQSKGSTGTGRISVLPANISNV